MRLLLDENMPKGAVDALVGMGHDVRWVLRDAPGLPDQTVIAWALREGRVLVSLDKDFGELAFRAGLAGDCGVVLLRLFPPMTDKVVAALRQVLLPDADLRGAFVVVEEKRIRRRPLA